MCAHVVVRKRGIGSMPDAERFASHDEEGSMAW
jgi:hypothetical protein